MIKIIEFLYKNPNPTDVEVHEWVEENDLNIEEIEEQIYSLATAMVNFLHEGYAFERKLTEDKVDYDELEKGIKVEMEHTNDPMISKRIAMDHLSEIPDYYTRLEEIESKAKKGIYNGF